MKHISQRLPIFFHYSWVGILLCISIGCASVTSAPNEGAEPLNAATDKNIPDTSKLIPTGWRETLISVTDLDAMVGFYTEVLGWEVRNSGAVPTEMLAAWALPKYASARYALVANPKTNRGFVRIIDFDGVDQVRIRDHAQSWETGGIYNMNIRVADIADIAPDVTEVGWQAPSAPVQFTFGPFIVWEWIPRHKDGVRIAFSERVAPPLEDWPNLKISSRSFNSTQIVADFDRSIDFYQGILGFDTYLDHRGVSESAAEHVLGLSHEAMTSIEREVRIVNPGATAIDGSIEILAFDGYSGRDFSERAVPPNLGNLMLRFPVPDVDALADYLERKGVTLEYEPTETILAPYGAVKIIAIRAPEGAWLEFFEEI